MSTVTRDERALLVVANLSTGGDARYQLLYQWLDANALNLAKLLMRQHYRQVDTLSGAEVTSSEFVHRIVTLAQDPQTRAVDVILVLHGLEGALYFDDGLISSSNLGERLLAADLSHRLRLLYSTACYGATHVADFLEAGFRVASGAKGVCANGPVDYPTQLFHWGQDRTYEFVVRRANNPVGIAAHDAIARALGFQDVNSEKIVAGKVRTRITSEAA